MLHSGLMTLVETHDTAATCAGVLVDCMKRIVMASLIQAGVTIFRYVTNSIWIIHENPGRRSG